MVTVSAKNYWEKTAKIEPQEWLAHLPLAYQNSSLLQQAADLAFITGNRTSGLGGISCWQHGLDIADTLINLAVDQELLAAALLYPTWNQADLNLRDIGETLSKKVAHLLAGSAKMDAVSDLHHATHKNPTQIENCRKMLLAMVEDLRVVLLKLSERLHALRTAHFLPESEQKKLGEEILTTFAPLANRLGLGELKWQIEDLAFRLVNPKEYKKIASGLAMKRSEREMLIKKFLNLLENQLHEAKIKSFQLLGRPKHIYSIYKKMIQKNLKLDQLYDISAVRILVNTIEECYSVLDIVQQNFEMIHSEFTDYISAPKKNGYRSIHMAVYGPDHHIFEIQVRTYAMHQESELGGAAHWRYKENTNSHQDYAKKIAWLREILSWQNEVEAKATPTENVLSDRVYVLTPKGDIIDLPQGATPLDFAYTIHSNVGHRCRGVKINGQIATLTTPLKMGDQVEILTTKHPNPSRDWLNNNLGFLTTARARAKVMHWFRQQDYSQHVLDGKNIVDRELKRLNLNEIDHDSLAQKLEYETREALYAALGSNVLRPAQLINRLDVWYKNPSIPAKSLPRHYETSNVKNDNTDILVEGTAHWLTHIAQCCQPIPGDAIAGYISQKHTIAIHKINCQNFLNRHLEKPERVLSASWGKKQQAFLVTIILEVELRPTLHNEIMHLISQEKLALLGIKELGMSKKQIPIVEVYIRLNNLEQLNQIITRLQKLPHVHNAYRKNDH